MQALLHSIKRSGILLVLFIANFLFTGECFSQVVVSTNPASPFIVPAGVSSVKFEVWGGGGAGGGCNSALASYGSGGGGGAYNAATITVSSGQSYTLVTGAGGTGVSNVNGNPGTATTVTGPSGLVVTGNPGAGGARTGGAGGVGGTGIRNGGTGGVASSFGASGGGGAGNAGNGGAGGTILPGTGGIGSPNVSPYVGGAGGGVQTSSTTGIAGAAPGGAGGGGYSLLFNGNKAGGAGGAGRIVVTYCSTPVPTVTTPVTYCQNKTAVQLTATGTSLLWYTTATGGTGSATAPTPSTLSVGTTPYYVSSTNGCEGSRAQINVVVNATPVAPTVSTPVTYCQNSIAAALTASGSNLLWYTTATGGTGAANAPIPSTATVGTIPYYVSSKTGSCEGPRAIMNVTILALTTVNTIANQVICTGNSTAAVSFTGGLGGTIYNWTNDNTSIGLAGSGVGDIDEFSTINSSNANQVATITVTPSANGCTGLPKTFTITVNTNSVINLSSEEGSDDQVLCINTALVNITYLISGSGNAASVTSGSLPAGVSGSYDAGVFTISGTPSVSGTFNYTVTATGSCAGASISGSMTIIPDGSISLTSLTGTDIQAVCTNSSITPVSYTLGGSALGAEVSGLPPGVTSLFNAGVLTISGTATVAGVYNFQITTTGGGCNQVSAGGTITVNAAPTATIAKTNVSVCGGVNDGTIAVTANGSGPFTYSWTGITGSGNPATTQFPNPGNVSSLSGLDIGYYNLTVTDVNSCTVAVTGIHIQYAFLVYITNNGSASAGCANTGSIILYGNAGVQPYTYSLNGTDYQMSNTFINLAPGSYTAYVKDAAGCINTKVIFVAAAPPIIVTANSRSASSCSNDGSIQLFRTGGVPPYSYSMNNITYQLSNEFLNLAAGNYTGYVKDSKGCLGVISTTVVQGTALTITASRTSSSSCVNDGTIQLNPLGGVAPYTYSLNNITYQPGNSFAGLAAGNYTGYVKDSKGCFGQVNVTVNINNIAVTAYVTAATNCATNNGSIQVFRTGGTGPYTYSIDGNNYQSSSTFTGLMPGEYDGFVKDSKACLGALLTIVVGPDCPRLIASVNRSTNSEVSKVSVNTTFNIQAYPNPSNTEFKLILPGNNNDKVMITVTDIFGKKVYVTEGPGQRNYTFGKNLVAGIYFLKVIQGNKTQSLQVVKQ